MMNCEIIAFIGNNPPNFVFEQNALN